MIKLEMRETKIYYCDECGKETSGFNRCYCCGKIFCESHLHELTELPSMMHFTTSRDTYCNECIINPPDRFKMLLQHYMEMRELRRQEEALYARIKPKWEELEKVIHAEKDGLPER